MKDINTFLLLTALGLPPLMLALGVAFGKQANPKFTPVTGEVVGLRFKYEIIQNGRAVYFKVSDVNDPGFKQMGLVGAFE